MRRMIPIMGATFVAALSLSLALALEPDRFALPLIPSEEVKRHGGGHRDRRETLSRKPVPAERDRLYPRARPTRQERTLFFLILLGIWAHRR